MSIGGCNSLGSSIASTALLAQYGSAGLFSRITMTSMTSAWYHRLEDHIEVVLMCLVIFEVLLMRYFLILPIDLTKLIEKGVLLATVVSKRKRRDAAGEDLETFHHVLETTLNTLHRIDEDGCFKRSLCELESRRNGGFKVPKQLSNVLRGVLRIINDPDKKNQHGNILHFISKRDIEGASGVFSSLKPFHQAIAEGGLAANQYPQIYANSSASYCDQVYKKCSMSSEMLFNAINLRYIQVSEDFCDLN